jgi:hypothetical protein
MPSTRSSEVDPNQHWVLIEGKKVVFKDVLEQLHQELNQLPVKRLPSHRSMIRRTFTLARSLNGVVTQAMCDQVIKEVLRLWEELDYLPAFRPEQVLSTSLKSFCSKVTVLYGKRDIGYAGRTLQSLTKMLNELDIVFDVLDPKKLSELDPHDLKFYRAQLKGEGYIKWKRNCEPDLTIV